MSQQNPNPNPSQSNPQDQEPKDLQNQQPGSNPPEPPKTNEPTKPTEKKETHFYGNTDKERKHKLPLDYKDKVVVNQVKIRTVEGNVVELENTRQIQTYDVEFYEKLMKMEPDFFAEAKMRARVLHDPRAGK